MKHVLLAALTLGAASAAAASSPSPPLCRVVIYRDYVFAFGYYAVPNLAPECPPGSTGRLRKSSTLNTKAQGAAFQPIRPDHGAWTVSSSGDDVPNSEQLMYRFSTWEWQYFTGKTWQPAEVR